MSEHTAVRPGQPMPGIVLDTLGGPSLALDGSSDEHRWRVVIVYRGAHCPICKRFLSELEGMRDEFREAAVELVAISADAAGRARPFIEEIGFSAPVGVGLSLEDMDRLGVYISDPRNPEEAPAPFAEPALFVVRPDGCVQLIDKASAPFVRPDMTGVLKGLAFIREKDYPVRGTHGQG